MVDRSCETYVPIASYQSDSVPEFLGKIETGVGGAIVNNHNLESLSGGQSCQETLPKEVPGVIVDNNYCNLGAFLGHQGSVTE